MCCSAQFLDETNNTNSTDIALQNTSILTDLQGKDLVIGEGRKILLLHFSHLITPGQTIIQGMQNKYEKNLPTISFLQRVH